MTARISKAGVFAGVLLAICNSAVLADTNVTPSPPKPDFAAENPGWVYDAKVNCWALDNSHHVTISFTWSGDCTNNQITGKGTLVWFYSSTQNRTMTGTFSNGVLNGTGRVDWPDGSFSEGAFHNGELNGAGTQRWSEGGRYTGEFRDGKPDGRGHYDYADGTSYEGEFKEGKRNGHGKWKFAGGVYKGEFQGDEVGGHGVLHLRDGRTLEGDAEPPRYDPANLAAQMYPPLSRRLSEQGSVEITFTVLINGRADNVKLMTGSGFRRLDEAAMGEVATWNFTPAHVGNVAVAMPKTLVFQFQLQG